MNSHHSHNFFKRGNIAYRDGKSNPRVFTPNFQKNIKNVEMNKIGTVMPPKILNLVYPGPSGPLMDKIAATVFTGTSKIANFVNQVTSFVCLIVEAETRNWTSSCSALSAASISLIKTPMSWTSSMCP